MTDTLLLHTHSHWSSSLTIAARSAAALLCTSHAACSGAHSSRSEKRTTQRAYLRALDTADILPTGETRELERWELWRRWCSSGGSRVADRLFTYEDVIRLPAVINSRSRGYASSPESTFKGVRHSLLSHLVYLSSLGMMLWFTTTSGTYSLGTCLPRNVYFFWCLHCLPSWKKKESIFMCQCIPLCCVCLTRVSLTSKYIQCKNSKWIK